MGKAIDSYHQAYHKFPLIGDLSADDTEPSFSQFMFSMMQRTFSLKKPALKAKNSLTITAGLSGFYKSVMIVLKSTSAKSKAKVITEIVNRLMKKLLKLI